MSDALLAPVLRHIRRMVTAPEEGERSDACLLQRFVRHHDREAFGALVRRHGPLVWRVCRRVAAHAADAEDACQATLLVFARRAGHRAVAALLAVGDTSVALLARRLEPVRRPPAARVARLLADLDSEQFTALETATRELAKVAEAARPALERARSKASLEARRRLAAVLKGVTGLVPSAQVLRGVRAVLVLEQVGTPAARKLLRALAGGVPEARLTREAEAALERMTRRPSLH